MLLKWVTGLFFPYLASLLTPLVSPASIWLYLFTSLNFFKMMLLFCLASTYSFAMIHDLVENKGKILDRI